MGKILAVALASAALCSPAAASDFERNIVAGAAVGAGVGAATGGPVGAAVGAAIGGTVVFLIRPDGCFIQNRRGEIWQVPCHGRTVRSVSACFIGNELSGIRQIPCPARL